MGRVVFVRIMVIWRGVCVPLCFIDLLASATDNVHRAFICNWTGFNELEIGRITIPKPTRVAPLWVVRWFRKQEMKVATEVANFADLIAALRPALGQGSGAPSFPASL